MAITKAPIIEEITDHLSLSQTDAKHSIETLLEIMKSMLVSGEDLMISGFGKFQVNDKVTRKGRNPATGEDITLDKRRIVTFKCSANSETRSMGVTHE